MAETVLSQRALNRATLARQLLLERAAMPVGDAVARLAGLNAQVPPIVSLGLAARLDGFRREEVAEALEARALVRATLMRNTVHVVTADDYLAWYPALRPVFERALRAYFKEEAARLDLDRLAAEARALTDGAPRSFPELRELLAQLAPGEDPNSLSFAARSRLPLVTVPPAGRHDFRGSPRYFSAEAWLGRPLGRPDDGLRDLVRRYLAAFGPATRQDVEAWSGLTGLRAVMDELAPELLRFRDEAGRALVDLPDAPRPGAEAPAPVRFLPEWDNLLLAHADRTRVLPERWRKRVILGGGRVQATFLVDGVVAGLWRIGRGGVEIEPFEPLDDAARMAVEAEGERTRRLVVEG